MAHLVELPPLSANLLMVPGFIPAGDITIYQFNWKVAFLEWVNAYSIILGRSGISHVELVCLHHIPDTFPCDVGFPPAFNLGPLRCD